MEHRNMDSKREKASSTVVGCGGVAKTDADTEDVTRDTYGFPSVPEQPTSRQERLRNAEHEAEQAGIPGVVLPESEEEIKERAGQPEPRASRKRR
jgi:hypothetical protein